MNEKLNNDVAQRKLRNLLRELGLRSVRSELEYSLENMTSVMQDSFGKPDQIFISPQTFKAMSALLSKDKED